MARRQRLWTHSVRTNLAARRFGATVLRMGRATFRLCVAALSSLALAHLALADRTQSAHSETVLGPKNLGLHDGAIQLRAGNAQAGIRLTRQGLDDATTLREQYSAFSNLCAGYILIEQYQNAVQYCDRALALNANNHHALSNRALARFYLKDYETARMDVDAGLAIAPDSPKLQQVSEMIEDAVNPVRPEVEIEHGVDDRGSQPLRQ